MTIREQIKAFPSGLQPAMLAIADALEGNSGTAVGESVKGLSDKVDALANRVHALENVVPDTVPSIDPPKESA